jgi:hypothetical protein
MRLLGRPVTMEAVRSSEEQRMTEQPDQTPVPDDDDSASHASVGGQVDQAGGGRTGGETSVDEDLGAGEAGPA